MRHLIRRRLRPMLARRIGRINTMGMARITRWLHDPVNRSDHEAIEAVAVASDGTRFFVNTRSAIEYAIWVSGGYEQALRRYLQQSLSPGEVFVDIGANIGVHSCCLARWAGPEGIVVAVEPIPQLATRLRRNVALNKLGNVIIVEAAAGSRDGEAVIYPPRVDEPNQMLGSLSRGPKLDQEGLTVSIRTVDSLVRNISDRPVKLLKIDVEGHELEVLEGAHDTLLHDRPVVIFEHSAGIGREQVEIAEQLVRINAYLSSVGYEIVDGVGNMLVAKARRCPSL